MSSTAHTYAAVYAVLGRGGSCVDGPLPKLPLPFNDDTGDDDDACLALRALDPGRRVSLRANCTNSTNRDKPTKLAHNHTDMAPLHGVPRSHNGMYGNEVVASSTNCRIWMVVICERHHT